MLKMRGLIFIVILSLPMVSSGYNCPDSTNLDDKSSREKCLYKVLTHWKAIYEKRVIQEWQRAERGDVTIHGTPEDSSPSGLRQIRHNTVSRHDLTEIHIKKIIEYNKILDRLEDEGVYQLPYRIPQPPSE